MEPKQKLTKPSSELKIIITEPSQVPTALGSIEISKRITEIVKLCDDVLIVDESSAAIGTKIISDANKLVKSIEAKRKALKEPYLLMSKQIDSIAKQLTEEVEKSVIAGKQKILVYHEEVERKKIEKQKELEEQLIAERQAAEQEQQRIEGILNWIKKYEADAATKIAVCDTPQQLAVAFQEFIKNFPPDSFFAEFLEQAMVAYEKVKLIGKARKNFITDYAKAESPQDKVDLKKRENEHQNAIQESLTESALELNEIAIHKESEIINNLQQIEATITKESIESSNEKVAGITKRWNFEIVDLNLVPQDFLQVNDAAIREWMGSNKEVLTDGKVLHGIKFFIEKGVRLS